MFLKDRCLLCFTVGLLHCAKPVSSTIACLHLIDELIHSTPTDVNFDWQCSGVYNIFRDRQLVKTRFLHSHVDVLTFIILLIAQTNSVHRLLIPGLKSRVWLEFCNRGFVRLRWYHRERWQLEYSLWPCILQLWLVIYNGVISWGLFVINGRELAAASLPLTAACRVGCQSITHRQLGGSLKDGSRWWPSLPLAIPQREERMEPNSN